MPWRRYEVRPCEGGREKGYVYEDSDGDEIESKDRVLWGVPYVGRVRVFQKGKKRHATGADDAGCEQPRNDPEVGEPECIRRPNGEIQPTRQQLRQQLLEQRGCEVPWNDPEVGQPERIRRCIGETQPITRLQLRQQRLEQQRQRLNLAGLM